MKRISLGALLVLSILTLSACNRGYGCPYGMSTEFNNFLSYITQLF